MIPAEWEENFFPTLYKGKGEAIDRGNYRGFKVTYQVMKLPERVLDFYICEMVDINEIQLGIVSGKGTIVAIFFV